MPQPADDKTRSPSPWDPEAAASQTNVNEAERGASILAGAALVLLGLRRGGLLRVLLSGTGTWLLYRGATGKCPAYRALSLSSLPGESNGGAPHSFTLPRTTKPIAPITVEQAITIRAPIEELREAWRDVQKLSAILGDTAEIRESETGELEWQLKLPFEHSLQFTTRWTTTDEPNMIAWDSLPNEQFRMSGSARLEGAPADFGTTIRLHIEFEALGAAAAINLGSKFIDPLARKLIQKGLRRFKSLIETGDIPTNQSGPATR